VTDINCAGDKHESFSALTPDPNDTVDQLRYFNEAEDLDVYRKITLSTVSTPLRKVSQSVSDVQKAAGDWQTLNPPSSEASSSSNMYSSFSTPYKLSFRTPSSALGSVYSTHTSNLSQPSFLQHRHYASSSNLPSTSPFPSHSDLTEWQRQHQEQLRRQRIDASPPPAYSVSAANASAHFFTAICCLLAFLSLFAVCQFCPHRLIAGPCFSLSLL
jgi:hypothetical protein